MGDREIAFPALPQLLGYRGAPSVFARKLGRSAMPTNRDRATFTASLGSLTLGEKSMKTKQDTPVDVGTAPAFPPCEVPEGGTIGSVDTTEPGDGTIGSAVSASENLADVAPNENE